MPVVTEPRALPRNNYQKGLALEKAAAAYLERRGLTVLEHNFHCRFGEIDLICRQATELVFVEVRYRKHHSHGLAEETITPSKQKKILTTVEHYLSENPWAALLPCRIDVVAINGYLANLNFAWIQNAISL